MKSYLGSVSSERVVTPPGHDEIRLDRRRLCVVQRRWGATRITPWVRLQTRDETVFPPDTRVQEKCEKEQRNAEKRKLVRVRETCCRRKARILRPASPFRAVNGQLGQRGATASAFPSEQYTFACAR